MALHVDLTELFTFFYPLKKKKNHKDALENVAQFDYELDKINYPHGTLYL